MTKRVEAALTAKVAKSSGRGSKPGERRGGRKKGTPNKVTADVRKAIALFAQENVSKLQQWLDKVSAEDPNKAASLFLQVIEYYIPKQARAVIAGDPDAPLDTHWTITVVRPK